MAEREEQEEEKLFSAIFRFNSKAAGLISGILLGSAIFLATNWLLIRGGTVDESGHRIIGPHLGLLSQFFIGYKVSFVGSLIGFAYGFAVGTIGGALVGWIYNKIVGLRN